MSVVRRALSAEEALVTGMAVTCCLYHVTTGKPSGKPSNSGIGMGRVGTLPTECGSRLPRFGVVEEDTNKVNKSVRHVVVVMVSS